VCAASRRWSDRGAAVVSHGSADCQTVAASSLTRRRTSSVCPRAQRPTGTAGDRIVAEHGVAVAGDLVQVQRDRTLGTEHPAAALQRVLAQGRVGPLRRVGPGHESGPSPPTGCSGDPGRAPGGTAGACPRPARGWAPPHPANSGRRSRFPRQQSDPVVRAEQATLQHVLEPSVHVGVRKPRSACARLVMSRHLLG
jgi:hypothetical protein